VKNERWIIFDDHKAPSILKEISEGIHWHLPVMAVPL
jgi:hypothetical protein